MDNVSFFGLIFFILFGYFGLLIFISHITRGDESNLSFFIGKRKSPWYIVSYGMIGATLSGITFLSVPGWVGESEFFYMQMVLGYVPGYLFISYVLLPIYYKMKVYSIYEYLKERFGFFSHKSGSAYFLLSRILGASLRLFLVAEVLQLIFFEQLGIPFFITTFFTIFLIWLYTHRGGIKTIIWTDTLQTTFMLLTVAICIYTIFTNLGYTSIKDSIEASNYSLNMLKFDDFNNPKNFNLISLILLILYINCWFKDEGVVYFIIFGFLLIYFINIKFLTKIYFFLFMAFLLILQLILQKYLIGIHGFPHNNLIELFNLLNNPGILFIKILKISEGIIISFIKYPLWLLTLFSLLVYLFFIKKYEKLFMYVSSCLILNLAFIFVVFLGFSEYEWYISVTLDRLLFQTSGLYLIFSFLLINYDSFFIISAQ